MGAQSINTVYTWDHRCRQQLLDLMGGGWEPEKK
jgi:RNA polymerase sigma-70 factor (ECF subfamily)